MRILIPISTADADKLTPLVDVLLHLKTIENHFVTFVPTASQAMEADKAANRLRAICPNVNVEAMPIDPIGGWPKACNAQFQWAMRRMMEIGNAMPIFWMELDCVPTQKFWADKIAGEYAAKNKACLGGMFLNQSQDASGRFSAISNDWMMAGCGVYPPDLIARTYLWKDLGVTDRSAPEPFDKYLRHELIGLGMAHTDLIGNRWRTKNYKADFSCENANTDKWGFDHSQNDASKAVVIHGVKDLSLYQLILGDGFSPAPVQVGAVVIGTLPESKLPAEIIEATSFRGSDRSITKSEVEGMFKAFKSEFLADLRDIMRAPAEPQNMRAADIQPGEPQSVSPGIWPVIKRKLDANNWRLSHLSKAVDLPIEELKTLLESKGYEAKPPGMWIKEMKAAMA